MRIKKIAGYSFEHVTSCVRAALEAAFPAPPAAPNAPCCSGPYPVEVYDDGVVFILGEDYFAVGFTFTEPDLVTFNGTPLEVIRTYVPAEMMKTAAEKKTSDARQVAMATKWSGQALKKTEKNMGTKVKKNGGADILQLAGERLANLAGEAGDEPKLTPEQSQELQAVMALLETAEDLYSNSYDPTADGGEGGEDEVGEGEDGGDVPGDGNDGEGATASMSMSEKKLKACGVVKMSPEQVTAWGTAEMKRIKACTDPVRKERLATNLEKALTYASLWTSAAFSGDTATAPSIPITIVPEAEGEPAEVAVPAPPTASGFGPAATGGATGVGGATSQEPAVAGSDNFVEKRLQETRDQITKLRGGTVPAKIEKSEIVWNESYVNALPDSAFLYVEANAQKNEAGISVAAMRHFPCYDMQGQISAPHVAQAIKMIPLLGMPAAEKAALLEKAQRMIGVSASVEKSKAGASERGDDGWLDDMSPPTKGRRVVKSTETFGHDDLAGKASEIEKSIEQINKPSPAT